MIPDSLRVQIERSVYNHRCRALFIHTDMLRKHLAERIALTSDYLIVDSMPLEVCKINHSSRSSVCNGSYYFALDNGFYASQCTCYYGYKYMSSAHWMRTSVVLIYRKSRFMIFIIWKMLKNFITIVSCWLFESQRPVRSIRE